MVGSLDEKGATWSVVDEYGGTPFEYRFDGGCGDEYCYNTYTAAFDSSGRFLLTAGTRKSVHVLEVSELATGRVLARRSWDLSVRHERVEMGEMMLRDPAPTPRAGEWVFSSSDNTAPHAPTLGLRLEDDQLHSTLLKGYDTAWYALGSDVFRDSDRLARGRSVSGARSGSHYVVTVTRGGERRKEYSYPDRSRASCAKRFKPGELHPMWLPNEDWLMVDPMHGVCEIDGYPHFEHLDGTPALIRLSDGRVFQDPMKVRLLGAVPSIGHAVLESLSPDRSGFVFDTHAVLPSGRLAELPSSGGHAWIPTPLSMQLRVDPSTVPEP